MTVKSSKPKKQRKFFYTRKLHARQKLSSAHLSVELRKEIGQRSLMLRTGDTVKVARGTHKKHKGKVIKIDYAKNRIFIEKLNRKKADGTEIPVPIQASNVIITEIERDDERRIKRKVLKKKKTEAETGTKGKKDAGEKKTDVKEKNAGKAKAEKAEKEGGKKTTGEKPVKKPAGKKDEK